MTRYNLLYVWTSFAAAVITVCSGKVAPAFLTIGAGPLFFAALLISQLSGNFRSSQWRYLAGFFVCSGGYILAFLTFNCVLTFSPNILGIETSHDVIQFRADVWFGLAAAACVAALALHVLTKILTKSRAPTVFRRALLSGVVAIVATFLINRLFHHYWSFMGVLLPVGEALFGWVAGSELERVGVARRLDGESAAGS